MPIASSPHAPAFCCPTRRRFPRPVSDWLGQRRTRRASARLNASSDGDVVYELNHSTHRRGRGGAFPVYVALPSDAVGPTAQTMRRKRAMAQSFRALAAAGVEGLVMEVWWGLVEREFPRRYDWGGYLEIVEMAKRFGLSVRAVMAFHQCGMGPDDPFWISLPQWVLEEMDKDPNVSYADRFGRRNKEYISLGCDILPILHGRSPIQAYADLMRNFRDTFRSFLGGVITGIQVGLGPGGELRYPLRPTQKLALAQRPHDLNELQCYDKYMLASLNACAQGRNIRTSNLMQNLNSIDNSWKTPNGDFLRWYSGMQLLHGERICREAETIFRGDKVNMSGKVAGVHNIGVRDGFVPIARMFGRYGFTMCCECFEIKESDEEEQSLFKQLVIATRECDIPLEGENYSSNFDDESFGQILRMSKFYSDGLDTPSFAFNFVRMGKSLFEPRNWVSFTRFVRQVSAVDRFRGGVDFDGGGGGGSPPVASLGGAVLAY